MATAEACMPCPPEGGGAPKALESSRAKSSASKRVPRVRSWRSELVEQKTISGTILVRKWVTDGAPTPGLKRTLVEMATHICPLEGCGKAFTDPTSLRKHMHTHGEKQYICQVCERMCKQMDARDSAISTPLL